MFWNHLYLSFSLGSCSLIVGWASYLISLNASMFICNMRIIIHTLQDGLRQEAANFPVKNQKVNTFGFVGQGVSIATTQFYHLVQKQPKAIYM